MTAGADLDRVFRTEWGAVVATLARRLGDLQAAEDAASEAFASAAVAWARDGVPPSPGAWLTVTAWRKALDQLRRDELLARNGPRLADAVADATGSDVDGLSSTVDDEGRVDMVDDRLPLVFACCHPALALDVRVALTLRYLAGLTTRQIASAFLLPEATLAQRLVRAKRKIRQAGIRFEVPAAGALADRLDAVRGVVYLVFNEGYAVTGGDGLIQVDLCEEAIWLGRMLHRLLPADAETTGLLALMVLHHSRAAARQDADGRPVSLAEQDRTRWRRELIVEGTGLLDAAVARRAPGQYQLQAAIAALHAHAPTFEATDWPQIAALYGRLARLYPSPVVEINRAVAVGMADGPHAGLAVLAPVLAAASEARGAGPGQRLSVALDGYGPLHAAHADLLERAGDPGARAAWARAAEATGNAALREELLRRSRG